MRTIIHIGQHKTGTTSLQYYLKNNRNDLGVAGLYVPDSLVGYKDSSNFILNVFSLNENRYSSKKEMLERVKPKEYFLNLRKNLDIDVSRHYLEAEKQGCRDVIWSNEGLYLLNSIEEYGRLRELFDKVSSKVVCVCCFREKESYMMSRAAELKKQSIATSNDEDSYRYLNKDSWLMDYERKENLIKSVFDEIIVFPYDSSDVVKVFMEKIGYSINVSTESVRMNVTKSEK